MASSTMYIYVNSFADFISYPAPAAKRCEFIDYVVYQIKPCITRVASLLPSLAAPTHRYA